jgi:hypothetical protein
MHGHNTKHYGVPYLGIGLKLSEDPQSGHDGKNDMVGFSWGKKVAGALQSETPPPHARKAPEPALAPALAPARGRLEACRACQWNGSVTRQPCAGIYFFHLQFCSLFGKWR